MMQGVAGVLPDPSGAELSMALAEALVSILARLVRPSDEAMAVMMDEAGGR